MNGRAGSMPNSRPLVVLPHERIVHESLGIAPLDVDRAAPASYSCCSRSNRNGALTDSLKSMASCA